MDENDIIKWLRYTYPALDMPADIVKEYIFNVIVDTHWPFIKGEIILLDSQYGREINGEGRKPSKWSVQVKEFKTFDQALIYRNILLLVDFADEF